LTAGGRKGLAAFALSETKAAVESGRQLLCVDPPVITGMMPELNSNRLDRIRGIR
jgi:hypothetical protein